ncbi:receptor-like protein EIX2 [Bidens hawaiensis]|uniref:receptor-like protein EIX2 n=1 Tax=Bidens hawaiensis TaxID=980011 RepID=UPI00404A751A
MISGGVSSCIEKERQALLDVKANLTDPGGYLDDWGSEGEKMDCCKWTGVTCDDTSGHVIRLGLTFYHLHDPYRGFTGNFSPSLQVLNQLRYLELSYFDFQSNPLPNFLGSLSNLQTLYISNANLSGPIPHQLANLSNLLDLDLSNNSLSGSIPFSLGYMTSLTYLILAQNQLGGVVPNSFGNSSSLVHLDLSQNLLNESLPSFAGCSSLISLFVANNFFSGSMPDFTGCTSLTELDLSGNILSGNIPNSVLQLSNLIYLKVSHNSLRGSIPNFIGCHSLSFLDLSSNQFHGNVSNSLGQVSHLNTLDLSSNSLEGVISEAHFVTITQLDYLDLSLNSLALDLNFTERVPFQLSTIKLQSCKLGPGFPMWIKTQRQVTYLDISNAGILDSVPDWLWNQLQIGLKFLNLSSNQIKGKLPYMGELYLHGSPGLDLSNNHFEGEVSLLPLTLNALNLSGNKFSGNLSFVCQLAMFLTFLDLSNNSFSGELPACWMNFQEKLVVLNLSNNNLSGVIPSSLGSLDKLEALYLRANTLVGEVPESLSNCKSLRFVDLGGNNLSGIIPEWIGEELSELYVLDLESNRFSGRLPSHLCWLYNLQVLDLSNNGLFGNIPKCFDNFTAMARKNFRYDMSKHSYSSYDGSYSTREPSRRGCLYTGPCQEDAYFSDNAWIRWKGTERSFGRSILHLLKSIDLSRNNLSGNIPDEITSLYELISLNLSFNRLHGEVPKDIGRLKYLESFDLSRNEFSGHIPWTLSELNFLSYLDLSFNNLSGRIPTGSQLQRFDYTSYTGNPQLCGPPLTPRCGISPVVEKKAVEEDEDDFWKSYYTGMGAGFAVGFLGISGALYLNRRCRYFFFVSLSHMKDWIYVTVVVYFGKLERKFRR